MTTQWKVNVSGNQLIHRDPNTGDVTTLTASSLGRAAFLPLRAAVAEYDERHPPAWTADEINAFMERCHGPNWREILLAKCAEPHGPVEDETAELMAMLERRNSTLRESIDYVRRCAIARYEDLGDDGYRVAALWLGGVLAGEEAGLQ